MCLSLKVKSIGLLVFKETVLRSSSLFSRVTTDYYYTTGLSTLDTAFLHLNKTFNGASNSSFLSLIKSNIPLKVSELLIMWYIHGTASVRRIYASLLLSDWLQGPTGMCIISCLFCFCIDVVMQWIVLFKLPVLTSVSSMLNDPRMLSYMWPAKTYRQWVTLSFAETKVWDLGLRPKKTGLRPN